MLAAGKVRSFKTMDLSPHGGMEWLMCGGSSVRSEDLRFTYYLAQCVWAAARGVECVIPEDINTGEDPAERLAEILAFTANVAVGIGSGRAGLKHKVHAVTHRSLVFFLGLLSGSEAVGRPSPKLPRLSHPSLVGTPRARRNPQVQNL